MYCLRYAQHNKLYVKKNPFYSAIINIKLKLSTIIFTSMKLKYEYHLHIVFLIYFDLKASFVLLKFKIVIGLRIYII